MRKIFGLTITLVCLFASVALAGNNVIATYFVVNCRESITLRESPSVYARELAQIPLGQAVGFIETAPNGFCKVNYDGLIGYALSEYLSPNRQSYNRGATVVNCRQSITLREDPSIYAYELAQIPLGARVRYLGIETNSFYKVEYRGMVGYVLKTYIELD